MCISNEQAFRLILYLKRVYHRYQLGHILLLLSYVSFILCSATAFYLVESIQARAHRAMYLARMAEERKSFIANELLPHIFNNTRLLVYIHDSKSQFLMSIINERLEAYEQELKLRPPLQPQSCTFISSLLFVFLTITSIGAPTAPATCAGRVLSMAIAIVGLPFTVIVIKHLGYLIALLFYFPCKWLEACWAAFRFCTLRAEPEEALERSLGQASSKTREQRDYRLAHSERLLGIPVAVAVFALVGWLTLGCIVVRLRMPWLDANAAFYAVFNELTTIGMRDAESDDSTWPILLAQLFYTLVGLAVISLFVNLLHSKFSSAYWLPGRLHMPLHPHMNMMLSPEHFASFESDEHLSECPLNHYTTLGVLQTDDKCPLLCIARRECAYVDAITQTPGESLAGSLPRKIRPLSPDVVILGPHSRSSRDDVNDLIVETYGSRQPRLITSKSTEASKRALL